MQALLSTSRSGRARLDSNSPDGAARVHPTPPLHLTGTPGNPSHGRSTARTSPSQSAVKRSGGKRLQHKSKPFWETRETRPRRTPGRSSPRPKTNSGASPTAATPTTDGAVADDDAKAVGAMASSVGALSPHASDGLASQSRRRIDFNADNVAAKAIPAGGGAPAEPEPTAAAAAAAAPAPAPAATPGGADAGPGVVTATSCFDAPDETGAISEVISVIWSAPVVNPSVGTAAAPPSLERSRDEAPPGGGGGGSSREVLSSASGRPEAGAEAEADLKGSGAPAAALELSPSATHAALADGAAAAVAPSCGGADHPHSASHAAPAAAAAQLPPAMPPAMPPAAARPPAGATTPPAAFTTLAAAQAASTAPAALTPLVASAAGGRQRRLVTLPLLYRAAPLSIRAARGIGPAEIQSPTAAARSKTTSARAQSVLPPYVVPHLPGAAQHLPVAQPPPRPPPRLLLTPPPVGFTGRILIQGWLRLSNGSAWRWRWCILTAGALFCCYAHFDEFYGGGLPLTRLDLSGALIAPATPTQPLRVCVHVPPRTDGAPITVRADAPTIDERLSWARVAVSAACRTTPLLPPLESAPGDAPRTPMLQDATGTEDALRSDAPPTAGTPDGFDEDDARWQMSASARRWATPFSRRRPKTTTRVLDVESIDVASRAHGLLDF